MTLIYIYVDDRRRCSHHLCKGEYPVPPTILTFIYTQIKACEIFIQEVTLRAWKVTEENKRRTLQKSDIVQAVGEVDMYDCELHIFRYLMFLFFFLANG